MMLLGQPQVGLSQLALRGHLGHLERGVVVATAQHRPPHALGSQNCVAEATRWLDGTMDTMKSMENQWKTIISAAI